MLPKRELELCFEESIQRLSSCGVECALYKNLSDNMTVETATALYDFYETVLELAIPGLRSILVRLYQTEDSWVISVSADTGADLSGMDGEGISVSREEGLWTTVFRLKGGTAK